MIGIFPTCLSQECGCCDFYLINAPLFKIMAHLTPGAVQNLTNLYKATLAQPAADGMEPFEFVKEVGTQLLRNLGVWSTTLPMADLSVGILVVVTRENLERPHVDPSITYGSLAPAKEPRPMKDLSHLGHEAAMRFAHEVKEAEEVLMSWTQLA